jgi:hypothetical protein
MTPSSTSAPPISAGMPGVSAKARHPEGTQRVARRLKDAILDHVLRVETRKIWLG